MALSGNLNRHLVVINLLDGGRVGTQTGSSGQLINHDPSFRKCWNDTLVPNNWTIVPARPGRIREAGTGWPCEIVGGRVVCVHYN